MSKVAEYRDWLARRDEIEARGRVEEYIDWYLHNPSPLTREGKTKRDFMKIAVENAALIFKGTSVRVRFTDDPPEARTKMVMESRGTIAGFGFISNGNTSQPAIVLQFHGNFNSIPSKQVIDIENCAEV